MLLMLQVGFGSFLAKAGSAGCALLPPRVEFVKQASKAILFVLLCLVELLTAGADIARQHELGRQASQQLLV
jgi:hypothetical protein